MTYFYCHVCQQEKPQQKSGGTGYAIHNEIGLVCYECCAAIDKTKMRERGVHYCLYFVRNDATGNHEIVNWPGTLRFRPYRIRGSRFGGGFGAQRTDAWFIGPDGKNWHGVNRGDNDIMRCKRVKG